MKTIVLFTLCSLIISGNAIGDSRIGNMKIKNFSQAKRSYLPVIWRENAKTFYCGCTMTGKSINADSCGYKPKKANRRAKFREWEHIVPASRFGALIDQCTGVRNRRACLRRKSKIFNRMEADLHNIVPAIGELNAARRDFSFGIIAGESRKYGRCDFEKREKIIEPREAIRGNIARAYFHMSEAYPDYVRLSDDEKVMFDEWNKLDPVDSQEQKRSLKIDEMQR